MHPIQVGQTRKISVAFTNLGEGVDPGAITWSSSAPLVATVTEDAQTEQRADLHGVAVGTATITATPANGAVPPATFDVKVIQVGPHSHIQVDEDL